MPVYMAKDKSHATLFHFAHKINYAVTPSQVYTKMTKVREVDCWAKL